MRRIVLASLALMPVPFLAASAQESLCNPCVDPPVNRIRRDDFNNTNATTTVTAEDMRNLGIISVADMVSQMRRFRPIALGDADAFPAEFVPVFAAAANHLRSLDYEPGEFNARVIVCPEGECTVVIYPAELGDASATIARECPVGYCATMVYSLSEERVVQIRD